jgi:hypothetical protein
MRHLKDVPLLEFVFYARDNKWYVLSGHRYIVCCPQAPFFVFAGVNVVVEL